jgi:hypothetical protein
LCTGGLLENIFAIKDSRAYAPPYSNRDDKIWAERLMNESAHAAAIFSVAFHLHHQWHHPRKGYRHHRRVQLLRKRSDATVKLDVPDLSDVDVYSPTFAYPKKSSMVFVAGFRKKFNQHWKISAHWRGMFAKNVH